MILILLVLLLLASGARGTVFCSDPECWIGAGGCVFSQPGVLCVYPCMSTGWFNYANNTCVQTQAPEIIPTDPQQVQRLCPEPTFCKNYLGVCTDSIFGELCEECNFNGFITNQNLCDCYSTTFNAKCATTITTQSITVNASLHVTYCDPWDDDRLGHFKIIGQQGKYGVAGALRSPTACLYDVYGPDPGVLKDSTNLFTCNTIVSSTNASAPRETCGGNGFWNPYPLYYCDCFANWQGVYIGYGKISCGECRAWWGPRVAMGLPAAPCTSTYTPDVLTGELAECGNHGFYDSEVGCVCDFSVDTGFWALAPITQTFDTLLGNGTTITETVTVQTCAVCSFGFDPPPQLGLLTACTVENRTRSPTLASPTVTPTMAPSHSPTGACFGCPLINYYENLIYSPVEYADVNFTGLGPCYANSNISVVQLSTGIFNVTFPTNQSYLDLQRFGALLADGNDWNFYPSSGENNYIYELIHVAIITLQYIGGGLGVAC